MDARHGPPRGTGRDTAQTGAVRSGRQAGRRYNGYRSWWKKLDTPNFVFLRGHFPVENARALVVGFTRSVRGTRRFLLPQRTKKGGPMEPIRQLDAIFKPASVALIG